MNIHASNTIKHNNTYLFLIGILSVVIPVVVAVLFYIPKVGNFGSFDVSFLPHLNAMLNTATSISLILGYIFIKQKKQRYHVTAMLTAFALSSIFLISYVIYHYMGAHTKFPGDGLMKVIYLSVLFSHIVLATIVVPFVLLAIYFGATKQYEKHKKIVKYTFPIWLYVAITGVLVYLMISPYYTG